MSKRSHDDLQGKSKKAPRTTVPSFGKFESSFREHHHSISSDTERNFAFYEPAYREGYRFAFDETYRGRSWTDVEPEVRSAYEEKHGKGSFTDVREASRYGFEHSRRHVKDADVKGPSGSSDTASGDPGSVMRE